jgi:hypothetical protein
VQSDNATEPYLDHAVQAAQPARRRGDGDSPARGHARALRVVPGCEGCAINKRRRVLVYKFMENPYRDRKGQCTR